MLYVFVIVLILLLWLWFLLRWRWFSNDNLLDVLTFEAIFINQGNFELEEVRLKQRVRP